MTMQERIEQGMEGKESRGPPSLAWVASRVLAAQVGVFKADLLRQELPHSDSSWRSIMFRDRRLGWYFCSDTAHGPPLIRVSSAVMASVICSNWTAGYKILATSCDVLDVVPGCSTGSSARPQESRGGSSLV